MRPRGGAIPAEGFVVAATGSEAAAFTAALPLGAKATLKSTLTADGAPFVPTPKTQVLTGGPELVRGAAANLKDDRDGFNPADDPTFRASFVNGQNPRTMAAVTRGGRILLIVVDGRQPNWSVGLPLEDAIPVLLAFGAERASNLDGGGSSTLSIGGVLSNKPSDAAGERPVADALLLVP